WHHYAGTFSQTAQSLQLYVDGLPACSPVTSTPDESLRDLAGGIHIGRSPFGSSYLHGRVDEVQLYPRALTEAQINRLYLDGGNQVGGPTRIEGGETVLDEVWNLSVFPISSSGVVGSVVPSNNNVTITDSLTVQFSTPSSGSSEATANPVIQVTLSSPDTLASNTISFTIGGTADSEDYTVGTLVFDVGETTQNFPLTILDDLLKEAVTETVVLTLTSVNGNASLGDDIVHTYTITDNDTMTVQLNGGTGTLSTSSSLSSSIDVNSTGGFTPGTTGAYRWIRNGGNFMSLNVPFGNADTTQFDFSGNNDHGTNNGAVNPADPEDCLVGDCLEFDGNDSVAFGTITHGPAYTISAWVNMGTVFAQQTLVGICDDPNSSCTGGDYAIMTLRVNAD